MAWISLNNLTRFYTKLKEKFYLKTEIDTKVNTLNTAISNISTVYYGDGVDSAIAPLNADQLQGHPASYFATSEALANSGLKMDLLWTNTSPRSEFGAQSINSNNSNYDTFFLEFVTSVEEEIVRTSLLAKKGLKTSVSSMEIRSVWNSVCYRIFTITDSAFVFDNTKRIVTYNANSDLRELNNMLVPIRIYGVK